MVATWKSAADDSRSAKRDALANLSLGFFMA
jgi:hypothetical protein